MSQQPPAREPEGSPPITEPPRVSVPPSPPLTVTLPAVTAPSLLPTPETGELPQQPLTKAKSAVMRSRNVYVTGLPPAFTMDVFFQFMSQFGPVESVRVARLRDENGRDTDRLYGFALMIHEASARQAIRTLNGAVLEGDFRLQARLSTNDIKGAKASRLMRARVPPAPVGFIPAPGLPPTTAPNPAELRPSFQPASEPTVVGHVDQSQPRFSTAGPGDMTVGRQRVFPPVPPTPVGMMPTHPAPAGGAQVSAAPPQWPVPYAFAASYQVPPAFLPPEWQPVPPMPAGAAPPYTMTVPQGAYFGDSGLLQTPATYPYHPQQLQHHHHQHHYRQLP
jgi:hypothetical protein